MGIRVSCPNGHSLNVKEHLAGRVGRCPKCGAPVRIPAVEEAPPPESASGQAPPAAVAPAPSFAPPTLAPQVPPPTASPGPTAPSVVVIAEEPLVAASGVYRDPRLVAKRRARQRRMVLILLSVLSLGLAALLAWVLLGQ